MELFVARQPIFDRKERVFAYELLFRSSHVNAFTGGDQDQASSQVIADSLLSFGLERLTGGKRAFVNFTRQVLVDGLFNMLPPNLIVVELLETITPDGAVLDACREVKERGMLLAIDDYVFEPQWEPVLELADIVKVDFMGTTPAQRSSASARMAELPASLLAEKVETREEFNEAMDLGYEFFQGFFFCKPEMVVGREVPAFKLNYLRFIQEVTRDDVDMDRLEEIIRQELSLSVKLLRYLNSASFGWRHEVDSIRQAIRLLGERAIKKWASLVAMRGVGEDKPTELVVMSLARARLCELAGVAAGFADRDVELFLMGLLSLVDALTDRPLDKMLADLNVTEDIRAALLGEVSPLSPVFQLAQACEAGDWERAAGLAETIGLDAAAAAECYQTSLEWADDALKIPA